MENNVEFNDSYKIDTIAILVIDYVNECASQGTPLPVNKRLARPFVEWVSNHVQAKGCSFNGILFRVLVVANFKANGRFVTCSYLRKEMKIRHYELLGLLVEAVLEDIGMDDPDTDSIVDDDDGLMNGTDPFFEFSIVNRKYLSTKEYRAWYHSVMVKRFCKALGMKVPPIIDEDLKASLRSLGTN